MHHGALDEPIAGGSLYATSVLTGAITASAFSGTTQLSLDPATGGLHLVDPEFDVVDGQWTMPLPFGRYTIGAQPVDGSPVPAASVSLTAQIGAIFGQQEFDEELWGGPEGELERRRGVGRSVRIVPGFTRWVIDIVTSRNPSTSGRFGDRDFAGFVKPAGRRLLRGPGARGRDPGGPAGGMSFLLH